MIIIKTPGEIKIMAEGGRILAEILQKLADLVKPNVATKELDRLARELVLSCGVKPAFLGYDGFPAAVCVSVNDEVVHGVPSHRKLEASDLVGLDMGISYKGFYTDMAMTIPVLADGESYNDWAGRNPRLDKLLKVARGALDIGISKAHISARLGEISHAIQKYVEKNGFAVVRDLAGHGVGRGLHEEPSVPNFGKTGDGPELIEGMVIAIEPMITAGSPDTGWKIKLAPDGQTFVTQDGSWSAHFEHTVAVTKGGPLILTKL